MIFLKSIVRILICFRDSPDNIVTSSPFVVYVGVPGIPLVEYLFSCFNNDIMEWNDFFQFIMFYALCPMSSYLYTLLHIKRSFDGLINFDLMLEMFSFVELDKDIRSPTGVELFRSLDLNKDNCLNFSQFCKFFEKIHPSCDLFYIFRIKLLSYFFPNSKYRTILNRRKNIEHIKEYQSQHSNRLPESSCIDAMNRVFGVNPNKYDYGCKLTDISFYDITAMIIKKYNPEYKVKKRKRQSSRFLNKMIPYLILNEIDGFYMEYNRAIPMPDLPSYLLPQVLLQQVSSSTSAQPQSQLPRQTYNDSEESNNNNCNVQITGHRKGSLVSLCSTDSCSSSILRKSSFGVLKQRKPTYHQLNARNSAVAFQFYKRSIQLPVFSNEGSIATPHPDMQPELPPTMSDTEAY